MPQDLPLQESLSQPGKHRFRPEASPLTSDSFLVSKMISAERNYATHDAELPAIVVCFKHWLATLPGRIRFPIAIITDHNISDTYEEGIDRTPGVLGREVISIRFYCQDPTINRMRIRKRHSLTHITKSLVDRPKKESSGGE